MQDLYRSGVVFREIAGKLDRDLSQTWVRIDVLRRDGAELPPRRPRWTNAQRDLLAQCRRNGYSLRELEIEFERTRGTITSQLRTLRRLGYDLDPSASARRRKRSR